MFSTSSPAAATAEPQQPPHSTRRHGPGRPWPKGTSGNATGKAKRLPDPGDLARRHARAAVRTLANALSCPDTAVAVAAATALLNQGFGLPRQHVAVGMPNLTMILRTPTEHETARANGEARAFDA